MVSGMKEWVGGTKARQSVIDPVSLTTEVFVVWLGIQTLMPKCPQSAHCHTATVSDIYPKPSARLKGMGSVRLPLND